MTITTESGMEDKMLSQMKLVLTLMRVRHTKDIHRMQRKVNGRWKHDRFRCTSRCVCYHRTNHSQVFSNELLEDRRANEWQTCHDGFDYAEIVNYGFTGWIIPGIYFLK